MQSLQEPADDRNNLSRTPIIASRHSVTRPKCLNSVDFLLLQSIIVDGAAAAAALHIKHTRVHSPPPPPAANHQACMLRQRVDLVLHRVHGDWGRPACSHGHFVNAKQRTATELLLLSPACRSTKHGIL